MKKSLLFLLVIAACANARIIPVNTTSLAASTNLLYGDTVLLNKLVYVDSGVTLSCEAGVIFKAAPKSGLVIAKGAKLVAKGTAARPVIFTALSDSLKTSRNITTIPDSGLWYGITILGQAPVKTNDNVYYALDPDRYHAQTEVNPKTTYGGKNDLDSSGSLTYVSIRYAGTQLYFKGAETEAPDQVDDKLDFNGLALCGVGSKTVVDHVEIYSGLDDGLKILGGSVNCRYIVSAFNADNAIDIDEGYRGSAQYVFGLSLGRGNNPLNEQWEIEDPASFRIRQSTGRDSSAVPSFANFSLLGDAAIANAFVAPDWSFKFCNSINYDNGKATFRFQEPKPFIANNLFRLSSFPSNGWDDFSVSDSEEVQLSNANNDIFSKSSGSAHDLFMGAIFKSGPVNGLDPRPWDSLSILYTVHLDTLKNKSFFDTLGSHYRGAFMPWKDSLWIQNWTALDLHGYLPKKLDSAHVKLPKQLIPPTSAFNRLGQNHQGIPGISSSLILAKNTITLHLPASARGRVMFYNIKGQCVKSISAINAGQSSIRVSDLGLSSGVYLCRLQTTAGNASTMLTISR